VGVETILFFVLFQKGGPLSAVPMVLAGFLFFKESFSIAWTVGIVFAITGLYLLLK
jgi:transporter family protein